MIILIKETYLVPGIAEHIWKEIKNCDMCFVYSLLLYIKIIAVYNNILYIKF